VRDDDPHIAGGGPPSARYAMVPTSIRRPSLSLISKTKPDRPIVTMETIRKFASLIMLPRTDPPLGRYLDFKYRIWQTLTQSLV